MDKLFNIDLQLFAEGQGQGQGQGGQQGDGGDAGKGGDKGDQGKSGKKVEFTPEQQEEVDRIVQERLTRAEKAANKKALEARAKELGFNTVEEMEAALKAHKEAAEKEKTDLQKANEAKTAAEAKAKAAEERAKTALIKAAFAEAGIAANLVSVDDAFKLADLSGVTVKDDGTVEGVKEVVEALVKAKPYLVKQGSGAGGGTAGNPGRGGGGEVDPNVEKAKQIAQQRNQQGQGSFDPWAQGGGAANQAAQIAQAVAAAVTQVLGNKQ